jgi:hypothetical protein
MTAAWAVPAEASANMAAPSMRLSAPPQTVVLIIELPFSLKMRESAACGILPDIITKYINNGNFVRKRTNKGTYGLG